MYELKNKFPQLIGCQMARLPFGSAIGPSMQKIMNGFRAHMLWHYNFWIFIWLMCIGCS